MNENQNEYRKNLAEKLNKMRGQGEAGKETAQDYLEMAKEVPKYKESEKEYAEVRKGLIEKKKVTKAEEEKKIEILKESILENKESGPDSFFKVFNNIKEKLQNKDEFGEYTPKGCNEVQKIMNNMKSFFEKVKDDYKKEKDYSGLTPQEFLDKYGLGNMHKFSSGQGMVAEQYSLDNVKKINNQGIYNKTAISSFYLQVFKKWDWKMEARKFPGAEWKTKEEHELTFTPKQEDLFYRELTGLDAKGREELLKDTHNFMKEIGAKIPGMSIQFRKETQSSREDGKPIDKGIFKRYYGWKTRESDLVFGNDFLKSALEEVK